MLALALGRTRLELIRLRLRGNGSRAMDEVCAITRYRRIEEGLCHSPRKRINRCPAAALWARAAPPSEHTCSPGFMTRALVISSGCPGITSYAFMKKLRAAAFCTSAQLARTRLPLPLTAMPVALA